MDGLPSNVNMLHLLGGRFDHKNLKCVVTHPLNSDEQLVIMFDPIHCLKLVRNHWAQKEVIETSNGTARWEHIVFLQKLQEAAGFRAAIMLTCSHIDFKNKKIKVSLAHQVLSFSVAKGLRLCRQSQISGYEDADATEYFVELFDGCFDLFNCMKISGRGPKSPIHINNASVKFQIMERLSMEIVMLKWSNSILCVKSKQKTGFLGFLADIQVLEHLINAYVLTFKIPLLLTYKFSQDHLEIFFSCVRRCGGWCNNPNAQHFCAAYRKLLFRAGVKPSDNGNCSNLDVTNLLHLGNIDRTPEHVISCPLPKLIPRKIHLNGSHLSIQDVLKFETFCIGYIAGWVVRKVQDQITCDYSVRMYLLTVVWWHPIHVTKWKSTPMH